MIKSFMEGRIRAAVPPPASTPRLETIKLKLMKLQGIGDVSTTRLTGSVLVTYDPATITSETVIKHLEISIHGERRKGPRQGFIRRRPFRRIVNHSMLASFAVCLAGLAIDMKKTHVNFGYFFSAALLMHLFQNSKSIIK